MLKLFLWFRYLRSKKIVFLSIAAVALSVALMIVIDSLFTGVISGLKKNYATEVGDIYFGVNNKSLPKYEIFLSKLESIEGVQAAAPFLLGGGLLYVSSGDVREVAVQGINPFWESRFTNLEKALFRQKKSLQPPNFKVPDDQNENGGWVGIGVIAEPNEKTDEYDPQQVQQWVGKKVTLITTGLVKVKAGEITDSSGQKQILYEDNQQRRLVTFRISDIFFSDTYAGDRTVYLPIEQWQKVQFGDDDSNYIGRIKVKLQKGANVQKVIDDIRTVWKTFAAQDLGWPKNEIPSLIINTTEQVSWGYLAELHKQMMVLLLIFGVICSVAILLVFCIFYMIVQTKQKDVSIIKSCGATDFSVAAIFTGFGGCIGIVGAALGVILGMIVISNINTFEHWIRIMFGLRLWRSSAYQLNQIPNQLDWASVGWIVPAAIAGCFIGALLPAIIAARAKPVDILRYE